MPIATAHRPAIARTPKSPTFLRYSTVPVTQPPAVSLNLNLGDAQSRASYGRRERNLRQWRTVACMTGAAGAAGRRCSWPAAPDYQGTWYFQRASPPAPRGAADLRPAPRAGQGGGRAARGWRGGAAGPLTGSPEESGGACPRPQPHGWDLPTQLQHDSPLQGIQVGLDGGP